MLFPSSQASEAKPNLALAPKNPPPHPNSPPNSASTVMTPVPYGTMESPMLDALHPQRKMSAQSSFESGAGGGALHHPLPGDYASIGGGTLTLGGGAADEEDRPNDQLPTEVAIIEPILRFLQLLCENHNNILQNYLRTQNARPDYNLVAEALTFLDTICGSTKGSLGVFGEIGEHNFSLITQALITLTEFCQGPCHENQASGRAGGFRKGWEKKNEFPDSDRKNKNIAKGN